MDLNEDQIALAAEYALGTLDADERTQVETMMGDDKEFAAIVQAWELRLGALNQMVGSVEPRPLIWDNIKAAIGQAAPQAEVVLPEAPSSPPPALEQGAAPISPATAAVLLAMIGVQLLLPDLLPDAMRPTPQTRIVEVRAPAAQQPAAQYVALLQGQAGGPAFILTVDGASKNLTVRKVGAPPIDAAKSYELWL